MHFRLIQVSETPLSPSAISNFSIGDDDLTSFFADYWGDEDKGDALEVLQEAFGDSIVESTDTYIVISKSKLGSMLKAKYESWRSAVASMPFDDAIGRKSYMAMRATSYLSTGNAIFEHGWNGCGEHTWDYLSDMYRMRFKDPKTGHDHRTFKLYYGASLDFHV